MVKDLLYFKNFEAGLILSNICDKIAFFYYTRYKKCEYYKKDLDKNLKDIKENISSITLHFIFTFLFESK